MLGIRVENLGKVFGKFEAVAGISFEVRPGEIYALLGPNDSGKTTTVRMLSGLLKPSSGDIFVQDRKMTATAVDVRAFLGVMPGSEPFFEGISLWDHLILEARVRGFDQETALARAEDLLRYFDLWEKRHTPAELGSVGMKKKLGLSLALIHNPPVLILDEPFEGLDPVAANHAKEVLIKARNAGTALFITTHMLYLLEELVDRVAFFNHGKILSERNLSEIKQPLQEEYIQAFGNDHLETGALSWLD